MQEPSFEEYIIWNEISDISYQVGDIYPKYRHWCNTGLLKKNNYNLEAHMINFVVKFYPQPTSFRWNERHQTYFSVISLFPIGLAHYKKPPKLFVVCTKDGEVKRLRYRLLNISVRKISVIICFITIYVIRT